MFGTHTQVSWWELAALLVAPFALVWTASALHPALALLLLIALLDVGALVGGADSRPRLRKDW